MLCLFFDYCLIFFIIFFFQAEDGIRDRNVTGVSDVCSSDLPGGSGAAASHRRLPPSEPPGPIRTGRGTCHEGAAFGAAGNECRRLRSFQGGRTSLPQIGRASCRERVKLTDVALSLKQLNIAY